MRGDRERELEKLRAGGDPILEEILLWNMQFSGRSTPSQSIVREGVPMWMVGRNASHEFYAGTKDGKRYRYSVGESCRVDIDGNPLVFDQEGFPVVPQGLDRDFREVADFNSYYGHF